MARPDPAQIQRRIALLEAVAEWAEARHRARAAEAQVARLSRQILGPVAATMTDAEAFEGAVAVGVRRAGEEEVIDGRTA